MNCLTEVLGMGLQGNGTIPAVYSERIKLAKHAGVKRVRHRHGFRRIRNQVAGYEGIFHADMPHRDAVAA